jgi:Zn-dependent protease
MLHEPASTREDRPAVRAPQLPLSREEVLFNELRQMVAEVMAIDHELFAEPDTLPQVAVTPESRLIATFEGQLTLDSEAAYDRLDARLAPLQHIAAFRLTVSPPPQPARPHTIHILTGRANPRPRSWWPNALLFIATLVSLLLVGTTLAISEMAETDVAEAMQVAANLPLELWRGFPYALGLLLILGSHELGHYFAARRHKLAVTLPYFIPLPFISLFGTMGAFIQLRQPMKNRKMLFDVGASGPLIGLIFAVPILFIGLATTRLTPAGGGGLYEGDSLLYAAAKIITFGHFLPDGRMDVCVNCSQLLWAGWTGLLVTALNLLPLGQLDGGHVLYALVGDKARRLYFPIMGVMFLLVFVTDVWLFWLVLLLLFGRVYATPLDMITPLDSRRRVLAIFTLIVFVLIFVPAPLAEQAAAPALPDAPRNSAMLLPLVASALVLVRSRLRR